jgi:DNA-binding transcriptional ArsR family regulator
MAFRRSDRFPDSHKTLAAWARALGHPARIALLEVLAGRSTCTCGQLVDELPLAQATVSQHLKALKDAGLIVGTIDGPRSCYCVDLEAMSRLADSFKEWFGSLENELRCCQTQEDRGFVQETSLSTPST